MPRRGLTAAAQAHAAAQQVGSLLPLDWALPAGVAALQSTRLGGYSAPPYAGFNLGTHVGDAPASVAQNRALFASFMNARPIWLNQVHGSTVVDAADVAAPLTVQADGIFTTQAGLACCVMVADCMPVLMASADGRGVAAAHAGWRGLAAGVLENTLAALCRAVGCGPGDIHIWLGPCIGPQAFEVGAEVVAAFGAVDAAHFVARRRADGRPAWLADLPGLARARLARSGAGGAEAVGAVAGGGHCTVSQGSNFFSFRRDGVTGRMAAAIWLEA